MAFPLLISELVMAQGRECQLEREPLPRQVLVLKKGTLTVLTGALLPALWQLSGDVRSTERMLEEGCAETMRTLHFSPKSFLSPFDKPKFQAIITCYKFFYIESDI